MRSIISLASFFSLWLFVVPDGSAQETIMFDEVSQQQIAEEQTFNFQLPLTGTSNDTLVFLSPNLPSGSTLNAVTGQFLWVPSHPQVGPHYIDFVVRNTAASLDTVTLNIVVTAIDHAPELTPLPDQTVNEGGRLQVMITATDHDPSAVLTFTSPDRPKGSELDVQRGIFSWIPDHTQIGGHLVTFMVSDDTGRQDQQTITITVNEVAHAPVLTVIPDQVINDGERLLFVVRATDQNRNERLTFTAPTLPQGATLNPQTGIFSWIPKNDQVGIHILTFHVTDRSNLSTSQRITIRVNDIQHAPKIRPIGDKTARIGERLMFQIVAMDLDNDPLFYTMSNPPLTALVDQTGLFSWTPQLGEISEDKPVEITFKVTDSANLSAMESIRISIGNIPHPPQLDPIPDQEIREGQSLRITLFASDEDGGNLRFAMASMPPGAVLDSDAGVFKWQPDYAFVQQGAERSVALRLTVTDPSGLRDESVINIKVIDTTNPAILKDQYRRAFVSSEKLLTEIDHQYQFLQAKTQKRKSWRTRLAIGSIVLGGATPIIQGANGGVQKWGLTAAGSLTAIIGGITALLSSEDDLSDELETLYTEREVLLRKGISLIGKYTENPPAEVFLGISGESLKQDLEEFNEIREEAEENIRKARIALKPNVSSEIEYFPGISK